MRLVILGASGRCGQWLVRLAVQRGHRVTAVVRQQTADRAVDGVVVIRADITSAAGLDRVLAGHDAVLSAVGLRRAGLSPWSALQSPPDLTTQLARALVDVMPRLGIDRLVAISAGGVGSSEPKLTPLVRRLVRMGNVGVAYRDLASMEATLAQSTLDWCTVRPVTLVSGAPRRVAHIVERYSVASHVRRSEVALWMLNAVELAGPVPSRQPLLGFQRPIKSHDPPTRQ